MFNAGVITHPNVNFSEDALYWFRKQIYVKKAGQYKLYIMAEARYKLYVNGMLVAVGPLKGNERSKYYDVVDIPFVCGEHVITAEVLQLKSFDEMGVHHFLTSVYRTGNMWFVAWGLDQEGTILFDTNNEWETAKNTAVGFFKPEYAFYTGIPEEVCFKEELQWEKAMQIGNMNHIFYGEPRPWVAKERIIPMPVLDAYKIIPQLNRVYDNGAMTTAYIRIKLRGQGLVRITYAERYQNPRSDLRTFDGGDIFGDYDLVYVNHVCTFEPFWFRCFRFLKIEAEADIQIEEVLLTETMYPLRVEKGYDFGTDIDNRLWEVSMRTLRLCMHETYEDCPYYEQLQYAMDTYLQIIYTYQVSGDGKLAKKAISDFRYSINGAGLTGSRAPSMQEQIIPGFSLFYILIVSAYYKWFHDAELFFENLPMIMQIVHWYRGNLNEAGLVRRSGYWHFIDWADGWEETHGAVQITTGGLGIETLMLSYVLGEVKEVLLELNKHELAEELNTFSKQTRASVERWCWNPDCALYADDETGVTYSQHMQVWAVLAGIAQGQRAKTILEKSFSLKSKSSFAFLYFLFRALEKAGLYEKRKEGIDLLRSMIDLNCSTIPETPENARSECHGWGAVALYEFTAMDLGVKVINKTEKIIHICPYTKERDMAEGIVWTPLGRVFVSWKKNNGQLQIRYRVPDGVQVKVSWSEGEIKVIEEQCGGHIWE